MKYHKLLNGQLSKYLPGAVPGCLPEDLLNVISESYYAQDREKELIAQAFRAAKEEYVSITSRLEHEVSVKQKSVEKLKEAIGMMDGEEKIGVSDDLLEIARYLNREVSKRKNAEQVFGSLIGSLQSGVMLENEMGRFVFVNQRFCELFGIQTSPESLIGNDFRLSIEQNKKLFRYPEKFLSDVYNTIEKRELVTGAQIELADGRIFERDYIPVFLEDRYKGNLWSFTDVTERIKRQEEYRRMSLVASANKSGVLFTSTNGRIIWANEGFLKLTGFTLQEVIGITPFELCKGPLTERKSIEKVLNAFFSGQPFNIEIIYYRKDGSWFWGRSNTQPVKDESGNITQFFGIIDDVTDEMKSEDQFRFALDKIGDTVWEHHCKSGLTQFSESVEHILGYSKQELDRNKESWVSKLYPEDRHLVGENFQRYEQGLQTHHAIEYRIVHKSGEIRWILDKGVIIERAPDNSPLKIIGIQTDITLIKRNETALRENEEQLRALTENIPGILYKYEYHKDGSELFSYIGPDCEKKIGLTTDQLRNFYQSMHPDDREREQKISHAARLSRSPYRFEGRFAVPDKPIIWLSLSSSFSHRDSNATEVHAGIILNITREKEAELGIRLREEKYRHIIANMNLGLLELDNENIIQFVNHSFSEMSGFEESELLNKNAMDLFNYETGNTDIKNAAGKRTLSDVFEVMIKNKSGENRWWLISGAPRFDDQGEKAGSIGIHLDITEQKKLEMELQEAKKTAESSTNAKQVFLANMSHEIRTPMNAILGMTNQLAKSALTDDQVFYLNIIHTAADNLLIIINDILDFSKLEAGKLNLERIGFRPDKLIGQAIQVMAHKAEEKGISLTNSFFDKRISGIVKGDPYRLNQIFLNLFSNSIKFTEKGGVDIRCQLHTERTESQVLEFIVTDSGIGMEESFLASLFQKFQQEDESVTRRFGGTGLGMSICKQLIEFMGGSIDVESVKNKGTRVSFLLPFEKASEIDLPVKEAGTVNTGILSGKRILVTDDNEMNRLVAITILREYGAILDEATNGFEAIEKIRDNTFDAVLMDIQMPVMDGLEATRIIRNKISRDLPVIALTALALKGDEDRFRDAGMTDYISKPFEETRLLQVVARSLGTHRIPDGSTIRPDKNNDLFSLKKINEIAQGNQEFVSKMIELFLEQAPVALEEILDSIGEGDFKKMNQTAHRFKTSLDCMEVKSLSEVMNRLEKFDPEKENIADLDPFVKKFQTTVSQIIIELKQQSNLNK